MKQILKSILLIAISLFITSQFLVNTVKAQKDPNWYTVFKTVDKNSFNEYRYLITKEFFNLKSKWEIDWILDTGSLGTLKDLVSKSSNYLPDNNLENDNLLSNLNTAIEKALKYSSSDAAYIWLIKAIWAYLDESSVAKITWEVTGLPKSWNAPFNVTLRANVFDPTGTKIPQYNYVWWMDYGSRKVNIWTWPSINYTFKEEWIFTVFVDIRSAHKNSKGYMDVIPYRWEVKVQVREKLASFIIKVNGDRLWFKNRLKFTPEQAEYWLLFDATSSTPTGSAKFIRTQWNFGNWERENYSWEPRVERVKYNKQWDYDVTLRLTTNLWKTIEKKFVISIRDPIATLDVSPKEWFLWDKFTFRAKNSSNDENLTYSWQIVDTINDEIIFSDQTKLFTYNFKNKWHFNVKLEVSWIWSSEKSIDTQNIYINSRAPVAEFKSTIPEKNKPNRVFLDATDSFDPDFVDTGKLKYFWEVNGVRVNLEETNFNWSTWFYTFDSIWDHSVVLRVEDPDNIEWIKEDKVNIASILSLDFSVNPRAIKRWDFIKFEAVSPEAEFFEWDFGDGNNSTGWVKRKISHKYQKTGMFEIRLKVIDKFWKSNTHSKVAYVWDWDSPVAIMKVSNATNSIVLKKNACKGQDAYIADRLTPISFDASDSIDIDWNNNNLDYSLKIWNNKYFTSKNTNYKFDELWCFPAILKVTSQKNRTSDTKKIWIKIENINPSLSKLVARTDDLESEPVIVDVNAIWAIDKDGVITSYLWYYYTDLDDEPQDFRATTGPSTRFVLPKITWNYYFVALLTDDSDSRISSKDIWKSTSLTLAWNNINVPIVELKTPDNSVSVWDEVIFNAKVQNILKQNISKKVVYFWDFDGDWFYDLDTRDPNITHVYNKPWKYYAKLKVKNKWFSNTRNIEINVANSLIPGFDYVSIWNKFIFINRTTWVYDDFVFDLWDWNKVENKDYFEHTYRDWKQSHEVELSISDWNKAKTIKKTVSKNVSNLLRSKKSKVGMLFMNPIEDSENTIELDERIPDVSVLLFQDEKDFSQIAADINLEKDSDLNGWKDDDEDISSKNENYLKIELNNNKVQEIRVYVKDLDWRVIISKDYKIVKSYIKDEDINLKSVVFEWVTDEQRQKLEELKDLVSSIVWDDWRTAKTYVARLKDEWNDETERTKIIYDFEWFLSSSLIENRDEIIEKLEDLLLRESDDWSLKSVALRALQWLTPKNLECEFDTKEYGTCEEYVDSTLEVIKANDNIDQNKILWDKIWEVIRNDRNLINDDKINFWMTLKNLIFWDVSNIPEEEIVEIQEEEWGSIISSILKTIIYILLWILFILGIWWAWYFVYYKVSNKNKDKWFKDFVKEKSSSQELEKDDIFGGEKKVEEWEGEKNEEKNSNDLKNKSWVSDFKTDFEKVSSKEWLKDDKDSKLVDNKITEKNTWDNKMASFGNEDTQDKKEKVWNTPDWLLGSIKDVEGNNESSKNKKSTLTEDKKDFKNEKLEKPKNDFIGNKKEETPNNLDDVTKEEDNQPDWLKWSLQEASNNKKGEESLKKDEEKKDDSNIPDWLKWSLEEKPKEETDSKIGSGLEEIWEKNKKDSLKAPKTKDEKFLKDDLNQEDEKGIKNVEEDFPKNDKDQIKNTSMGEKTSTEKKVKADEKKDFSIKKENGKLDNKNTNNDKNNQKMKNIDKDEKWDNKKMGIKDWNSELKKDNKSEKKDDIKENKNTEKTFEKVDTKEIKKNDYKTKETWSLQKDNKEEKIKKDNIEDISKNDNKTSLDKKEDKKVEPLKEDNVSNDIKDSDDKSSKNPEKNELEEKKNEKGDWSLEYKKQEEKNKKEDKKLDSKNPSIGKENKWVENVSEKKKWEEKRNSLEDWDNVWNKDKLSDKKDDVKESKNPEKKDEGKKDGETKKNEKDDWSLKNKKDDDKDKKENKKTPWDLWDDGMDVPDWLSK